MPAPVRTVLPQSVLDATRSYEAWLGRRTALVQADVAFKHEQMALSPISFLRATFYRWAQLWPETCPELSAAPHVLAVGDLHIANFGTWRDAEGRLVWGITDFDEAYPLAYTNDLVRLATSARLAIDGGTLALTPRLACAAIASGYRLVVRQRGRPFVLAEEHRVLRDEAESDLRDPITFWRRLDALPAASRPPRAAVAELVRVLPPEVRPRYADRRAGVGSLGHRRVVALAPWAGGRIAREAKALVPSACVWASGASGPATIHYRTIVRRAVRCPDPLFWVRGAWLTRRLAPDCSRIEFTTVKTRTGQAELLHAMGAETANVHLGAEPARIKDVIRDLGRRPEDWLHDAAKSMAAATLADYRRWSGRVRAAQHHQ